MKKTQENKKNENKEGGGSKITSNVRRYDNLDYRTLKTILSKGKTVKFESFRNAKIRTQASSDEAFAVP